ncbi:hypothetical protein PPERSA_03996 [Pseudocohnilembus persalinus]|uniref:Uncharacterized protein n=1 Tax=Pseudocohnilembus persalinus TaxID=266149 RepID=A0A0V0QBB2_PSEPJ|nr:hypothetical protein PPERSA_03996 [Pseudocohnilembus persalinus]|eukprot:KRW99526.1 hypothetical protein PPERSA_03996 [Pseudocohnilembus persalinus]
MDKLKGFINNEINQQQSKISTLENTPTDFYILLDMNSNFWSQDDYKKSNEFLTQLRSTFCTLLAYTFGNMVYIYIYDNLQSTLLFPNSESVSYFKYQGQNLESDNMEDLKQISHFTDGVFTQISHTSLNSLEQVTKYIFLRDQLASKILKKPSNIDWLDNLHDFNRYKEEQENSKQRVLINFYQMCCRCENNLEQQGKLCSHCLSYYCDECQQGILQCVKCNTNFDEY